ncbi:MAG: hypothetical protein F6J93_09660 [Oscillatoria sp. SIO1A7]|nr:hypothetical protein [Oscillatoria sp. SIO1A7]
MTKPDRDQQAASRPLPNRAIVYRALLRKTWIERDGETVTTEAYLLRPNEIGLSVSIASVCSPEQCAAKFRNCYGVVSLEVGSIRELGLDVLQDSPSHGTIIRLPSRQEDPLGAVETADLLAERSRVVWRP